MGYKRKVPDILCSISRNTYRDSFVSEGMSKSERSIFTCSAEIAITALNFSKITISKIGMKSKDRKHFSGFFIFLIKYQQSSL